MINLKHIKKPQNTLKLRMHLNSLDYELDDYASVRP